MASVCVPRRDGLAFQSSKYNSFKQADLEAGLTCGVEKEWLSDKETDFELRLLGFAEISNNGRAP
jgi:hypothetical protein